MLFSQRMGLKKFKPDFQIKAVSQELRNGLWDAITISFLNHVKLKEYHHPSDDRSISILSQRLYHSYFKKPLDTMPTWGKFYDELRKYFFECTWDEVFDFLEFLVQNYSVMRQDQFDYDPGQRQQERIEGFISMCNSVCERENSAYRFVEKQFVEITSQEEISSIEEAASNTLKATKTHIQTALILLSDRKKPDYRNSIKESISAVEATCNALLKGKRTTLGQALEELEKSGVLSLHKAEKRAYQALYGYTSDSDGIRHALLEESNLDFDDAKFMLVSCSAFCNYLISKAKDR